MTQKQAVALAFKRTNLTRTELAEKLGVTRQALSMWERGERGFTSPTGIEVMKALGIEFHASFSLAKDIPLLRGKRR